MKSHDALLSYQPTSIANPAPQAESTWPGVERYDPNPANFSASDFLSSNSAFSLTCSSHSPFQPAWACFMQFVAVSKILSLDPTQIVNYLRGLILRYTHCGKNLHRPQKLARHLKINECPSQYKCEQCFNSFRTSILLGRHMKDEHSDA